MKSNLSSFWLCYRCRDPIFSLEKPHTRSLENKEILKFHSDTFDRKRETVIFAQLKDFSKQQNKLTTSWNDSIAILLNHQPVCSPSIKKSASCRSGENKVVKSVKSLPKDRSFRTALSSPDRGLKLSEAEQKGTDGRGSCGTILRSSHLTFCVSREENMSSGRSDKRGTEQSEAVENQGEKYFRKHRLSTLTKLRDGFCFSFFFLFCLLFLSWLGEGGVVQ